MELELRPYQEETVRKVTSLYNANPQGKAKFVWATGLGKTVGFSAIANEIRQRTNTNVLIIAHREELLSQAAQKYRFIDPTAIIGKVGCGFYEWGAPITVASIQTICRPNHLKQLKNFKYGLVIVDECHHAHQHNEYGKVLAELPNAFKIGVTATDDRMDKISNEELFGESVMTMGITDAVEQGYLADLKAIAIKTGVSLEGLHTEMGDYKQNELAERIDTPERNDKIVAAYLQHAASRQAICFSVDIAHAEHLAEAFNRAGVQAVAISGKTSNRSQVLRDFEKGKYRVLCNCAVLTEGYDAETIYDEELESYIFLSCAIMARPTKSRALFTQCIGRILRLAPTKKDALVLDATDNIFNHRLEPQSLAKIIGLDLHNDETILEAKARKDKEAREKKERTIKSSRGSDLQINILTKLDWQLKDNGMFVLEVGNEKHRIALVPDKEVEGAYSVWARLAPMYTAQRWLSPSPLDWAQSYAEKQARKLLADPNNTVLVNREAAWRGYPATDVQLEKLAKWQKKFNLQYDPETVTRGEATELLDKVYESPQFAAWKQWRQKQAV